jgi:hypothetical protein
MDIELKIICNNTYYVNPSAKSLQKDQLVSISAAICGVQ